MQSPLEQTVTHAVPSFAILRLRFAVCILTSVSFVGELAAQETFSCLGGSSTRWVPPRFDTRIGDLACTIQYIGLTSSFLTILYNKIARNAIGIVKNMIFLKKGMGDTVQCAKCDRDVTGVV